MALVVRRINQMPYGFVFILLVLAGAYLLVKNDPLNDFDEKDDSIIESKRGEK